MEILKRINAKFANKYDFLKVLSVKYIMGSFVEIIFLYPESCENFSDDEKKSLSEFVKNQLNLSCDVKIKFKKSYLDEWLIKKNLLDFLKTTFPSMFAYYDEQKIKVERHDDKINIEISLLDVVYNYFMDNNIKEKITDNLNKNFIAQFGVEIVMDDSQIDQQELTMHEKSVIEHLPQEKRIERYPVFDPVLLCGQEITPMPEPIKNQSESKIAVILAGKISNLSDKTYISKRNKQKGLSEQSHYLTFTLTDHTSSIDAIYFANKSSYKKVSVLKDGDDILIVGDIKKDYDKKKLYVKSMALCEIDKSLIKENETKEQDIEEPILKNVHIEEYKYVKPSPYVLDRQENLFDVKPSYNDYITKNTFVVFDCETTGLSCTYNEIIEIGAVKIVDGLIKEQFQTFICPENEIPDEITKLTTITNDMVKDAPNSSQAITDFYKFCEGSVLVGYNVDFDLGFIQNTAKKAKLHFYNESVDAMDIVRKKMYLSRYKLINVVDALGLTLKNAHRAIADAIATAEVFLKLNEM